MKRFSAPYSNTHKINHLGETTRAKIVFLSRALDFEEDCGDGLPVNVRWTLQMNPHGRRLVRAGYFTVERSLATGRKKSQKRCTHLRITDKGRKEIARLARVHKLNLA